MGDLREGRAIPTNVSLPTSMRERLDLEADLQDRKRSTLVQMALIEFFERREAGESSLAQRER